MGEQRFAWKERERDTARVTLKRAGPETEQSPQRRQEARQVIETLKEQVGAANI